MELQYTNAALIQMLKEGNEQIFAHIYQKYHHAVYANICKLLGKTNEAEDILQEVFILLWDNRRKLTEQQEIGGWLFSTSYYKSMEQLKKFIRLGITQLDDEVLGSLCAEQDDNFEAIYAGKLSLLNEGMALLPPQKKSAFTLCRIHGKSYEEAATELGVSAETVKGYVKAAAQFLKSYVISKEPAMSAFSILCLIIFLQP